MNKQITLGEIECSQCQAGGAGSIIPFHVERLSEEVSIYYYCNFCGYAGVVILSPMNIVYKFNKEE